jgi:hypothetical protein
MHSASSGGGPNTSSPSVVGTQLALLTSAPGSLGGVLLLLSQPQEVQNKEVQNKKARITRLGMMPPSIESVRTTD